MTAPYRKKMIEVALPLEAINVASAREKSIRHGHPSTLHLWWARRPLAACRAVLFASLVDDPDSDPQFRKPDGSLDEEAAGIKRAELFNLIEDLVRWENSNNPTVINAARAEIARCVASRKIELGELTKDEIIFGPAKGQKNPGGPLPDRSAIDCSGATEKGSGIRENSDGWRNEDGILTNSATTDESAVEGTSGVTAKTGSGIRENSDGWRNEDGILTNSATHEKAADGTRGVTTWEVLLRKAQPEVVNAFLAEYAPPVLDPFCGGGSIPLEAQRLGLRAYASDLNPVPVLITKALIEIPPKFAGRPPVNPDWQKTSANPKAATVWEGAKGLADDVRYFGKWMRDEAQKRIGHLYPKMKITAEMAIDRPDLKE